MLVTYCTGLSVLRHIDSHPLAPVVLYSCGGYTWLLGSGGTVVTRVGRNCSVAVDSMCYSCDTMYAYQGLFLMMFECEDTLLVPRPSPSLSMHEQHNTEVEPYCTVQYINIFHEVSR